MGLKTTGRLTSGSGFDFVKAVWKLELSASSHKFVLCAIATHANARGICYPGEQRLAAMTSLSVRQVRRSIQALQQQGLLRIIRVKTARGKLLGFLLTIGPTADKASAVSDRTPDTVSGDLSKTADNGARNGGHPVRERRTLTPAILEPSLNLKREPRAREARASDPLKKGVSENSDGKERARRDPAEHARINAIAAEMVRSGFSDDELAKMASRSADELEAILRDRRTAGSGSAAPSGAGDCVQQSEASRLGSALQVVGDRGVD